MAPAGLPRKREAARSCRKQDNGNESSESFGFSKRSRINDRQKELVESGRLLATGKISCSQYLLMVLEVSTPALLFPAISLLFLSYTNRFLHLSALIRELHSDWLEKGDSALVAQIVGRRKTAGDATRLLERALERRVVG